MNQGMPLSSYNFEDWWRFRTTCLLLPLQSREPKQHGFTVVELMPGKVRIVSNTGNAEASPVYWRLKLRLYSVAVEDDTFSPKHTGARTKKPAM